MIKMIVTDLDNTLLRRDKTVGGYTVSTFRRLRERGILSAFATARSIEGTLEYRTLLKPDGCILTGGCLVYAGGKLIQSYTLPEPYGALLAELGAHPLIKSISARSLDKAYGSVPMDGRICVDFKTAVPENLLHCSCHTADGGFMKEIAVRYPGFSFTRVTGEDSYDINPKIANKLNGIKILCDYFNISLSEVISFGDDFNDVEMLRECGTGVAMGNAIGECKEAADYICGDCDGDGAVKWLERELL